MWGGSPLLAWTVHALSAPLASLCCHAVAVAKCMKAVAQDLQDRMCLPPAAAPPPEAVGSIPLVSSSSLPVQSCLRCALVAELQSQPAAFCPLRLRGDVWACQRQCLENGSGRRGHRSLAIGCWGGGTGLALTARLLVEAKASWKKFLGRASGTAPMSPGTPPHPHARFCLGWSTTEIPQVGSSGELGTGAAVFS